MSVVIARSGWLGRIALAAAVAAQRRRPETSAIGVGLPAIIQLSRRFCASEQEFSFKANTSGENVISSGSLSLRARYEDIPLGSRLEVRCGSLPTHVQTICGPSTDALKFLIRFFPRDKNIRGQNSRDNMSKPFTIRHGRRACTEEKGREVVWLEMPSLRDGPALARPGHAEELMPLASAKLVVIVPRWYFGVSIDSGGGDVCLGEIKHASKAEVWSRGGEISSESTVQAVHVKLITEGGSIKARRVVGQDVFISIEGSKTSQAPRTDGCNALSRQNPWEMRENRESHCGIDIQSIAGTSVAMEARHGRVKLGSCHIDSGGAISCGGFETATFRGPLHPGFNEGPYGSGNSAPSEALLSSVHQDCLLTLDRGGSAVIGGLDGCLSVHGEGAAIVDVQVNDGCRRLAVQMEGGENENATLMVGVSPTREAVVAVKGPVNTCGLPQDAVIMQHSPSEGENGRSDSSSILAPSTPLSVGDELSVRLPPRIHGHAGYGQDRYDDKPVSRLQRSKNVVSVTDEDARSVRGKRSELGNDEVNTLELEFATFELESLPCYIVVKGCGDVAIRRRSWMEARMAGLRSRRHGR